MRCTTQCRRANRRRNPLRLLCAKSPGRPPPMSARTPPTLIQPLLSFGSGGQVIQPAYRPVTRSLRFPREAGPRVGRYNISMYPEVRVYADPFEGLTVQLTELRGLIKIVPPLIDADRERRWREISERPSDGEDGDVVDVYGAEAGPEEGWGFADFGRTIRVAAVVFGWAVFQDYLAYELKRRCLKLRPVRGSALAALVEDDVRSWDRRFGSRSARRIGTSPESR